MRALPPLRLRDRWLPGVLVALLAAAAGYACALDDLFKASGPGDVIFVWVGDSVIAVDTPSPFRIELRVDGVVASSPAVRVSLSDTTIIAFGSTSDTLLARRPGQVTLTAWIETSLAPRVDTAFRVRSHP